MFKTWCWQSHPSWNHSLPVAIVITEEHPKSLILLNIVLYLQTCDELLYTQHIFMFYSLNLLHLFFESIPLSCLETILRGLAWKSFLYPKHLLSLEPYTYRAVWRDLKRHMSLEIVKYPLPQSNKSKKRKYCLSVPKANDKSIHVLWRQADVDKLGS